VSSNKKKSENNGTIPESELRQMLATVGDAMTHQEIDIVLQDVDVDDLGRINYNQLVDLLVTGNDELIR
jgi:Ca2+-binding EF-hand superfamily protein